jgi:hypothetical protein
VARHWRGDRRDSRRANRSGIPEIEAKRYEEKLKAGNYLIAVHTRDGDEEDRAKEIFKDARAEDITTSSMSSAPKAEVARA